MRQRPGEQHSEKYSMAQPNDPTEGVCIDGGRVAHMVGTYNEKDNTLNLYYNGVLVGECRLWYKDFQSRKRTIRSYGELG